VTFLAFFSPLSSITFFAAVTAVVSLFVLLATAAVITGTGAGTFRIRLF
jgi:hypothetical protein